MRFDCSVGLLRVFSLKTLRVGELLELLGLVLLHFGGAKMLSIVNNELGGVPPLVIAVVSSLRPRMGSGEGDGLGDCKCRDIFGSPLPDLI